MDLLRCLRSGRHTCYRLFFRLQCHLHRTGSSDYSNYYKVELVLKNKLKLKYIGFLDTGNKLKDPYLNRSIIIVDETKLKNLTIDNYLFVPINTVSGKSYIKCIPIKEIYINNKRVNKKVLLGISKKKINMDGIDCILNSKILEG